MYAILLTKDKELRDNTAFFMKRGMACQEAMKQIKDRNYEEILIDDGMKTIHRYGIACYKKRCKAVSD